MLNGGICMRKSFSDAPACHIQRRTGYRPAPVRRVQTRATLPIRLKVTSPSFRRRPQSRTECAGRCIRRCTLYRPAPARRARDVKHPPQRHKSVIPAKAGIQNRMRRALYPALHWVPACAGTTGPGCHTLAPTSRVRHSGEGRNPDACDRIRLLSPHWVPARDRTNVKHRRLRVAANAHARLME